jgi:hypothetical protein
MDSPICISDKHIFLVILTNIMTRFCFINWFSIIIPSFFTDKFFLRVNTKGNRDVMNTKGLYQLIFSYLINVLAVTNSKEHNMFKNIYFGPFIIQKYKNYTWSCLKITAFYRFHINYGFFVNFIFYLILDQLEHTI